MRRLILLLLISHALAQTSTTTQTQSVPGGTGTLVPSGTPTAGQIALWVNSTTLQGVNTLPSLSLAGTGAGMLGLTQGADNSANCPVNSECRQANSGIATKFTVTGPAAAATGFRYGVNSAGVITESIGELAGDCTTSASLTITCTKTNTVAFSSFATLSSTFSAHQFLGNNTSGSGTAVAGLIGTSDVSPNLYVADSGAVNVYVATLVPAMTAYTTGVTGCFKASASNTNATPTINFNGLGAKTIVKFSNGSLANGDIGTVEPSCVIYDGANFLLLNPQLTSGSGGIARLNNPTFAGLGNSGTYNINATLWESATVPTVSSGFGTSPSIVGANGTEAFTINVGTGGAASSGVVGFPAATTGWVIHCDDLTNPLVGGGFIVKQTASSTTTATVTGYNASFVATAWTASDILHCIAAAR